MAGSAVSSPKAKTKFTKKEIRDAMVEAAIRHAEEGFKRYTAKDCDCPFMVVDPDGHLSTSNHLSKRGVRKSMFRDGNRILDARTGRVHDTYESLPE